MTTRKRTPDESPSSEPETIRPDETAARARAETLRQMQERIKGLVERDSARGANVLRRWMRDGH